MPYYTGALGLEQLKSCFLLYQRHWPPTHRMKVRCGITEDTGLVMSLNEEAEEEGTDERKLELGWR